MSFSSRTLSQYKRHISIATILVAIVVSFFAGDKNTPSKTWADNYSGDSYKVVRVIDGDTFVVSLRDNAEKNSENITVRMIGINTPETVDPRRTVECFGKEASGRLKELIEGKEVVLTTDQSQGSKDRYGRILAYVSIAPAIETINEQMIRDGYAYEYTYDIPYRLQSVFKEAQSEARKNNRGLWDRSVCPTI